MSVREEVKRKLKNNIVRRTYGRDAYKRRFEYRAYGLYWWTHELALVLMALGFSHPLLQLVNPRDDGSATSFVAALASYPAWGWALTLITAVWFSALRLYVSKNSLQNKIPLYEACSVELGKVESTLNEALSEREPLRHLGEIQERCTEIVNRYYGLGGWPWNIGPKANQAIEDEAERLCEQHHAAWAEPSSPAQRVEEAAGNV